MASKRRDDCPFKSEQENESQPTTYTYQLVDVGTINYCPICGAPYYPGELPQCEGGQ